ncbi:hypothetical protein Emag_005351 [Eimeria magna]
MFFSSAKKAAESSAVNDPVAAGESPTKRGGLPPLSGASSGILHVLLFNPTLKPEGGSSSRDEQEAECSPSKGSPAASPAETEEGEREDLSWEEKEQEAKVIFSYPLNREPEERRSQAGLLEGLLMFTKPFSPHEAPLRSISTDKYTIVLEEVEPDYWLAISNAASILPYQCVHHKPQQQQQQQQTGTFAANDLPSFNGADPSLNKGEQRRIDEDTQEDILLGVLRCMYATFRLLHNRIRHFVEGGRRQDLQDRSRATISPLMNTPLDEGPLVGPRVGGPSYSGLSFDDDTLAVLYNYLVCSEGSAAVDMHKLLKPPFARVPTAAARRGGGCSSYGRAITEDGAARFIFGPVGQFAFLPSVHFADESSGSLLAIVHEQLLFLLVLDETDKRISDVSVSPLIPLEDFPRNTLNSSVAPRVFSSGVCTLQFLQLIRTAAVDGPCGLRELNGVLASEFRKVMKQEDTYRFIYFNHANRAIRM